VARERAVRIGIAEDRKVLSAVWRIWLHGSDLYIASRNIAHTFKTSLHATGKFRHAFVSDVASQKFRPAGTDRAVSKWDRPAPQAVGGTLLFQVLIPASELRPACHDQPMTPDVVWLPRAPTGAVTYISVLELVADASPPQFRGVATTTHLASWPTDMESTVWVTAFVAPITAEQAREIDRLRTGLRKQTAGLDLNDQPGEPRSHLRSFGIFRSLDGIGRLVDIDAEFLRDEPARHRRIADRAYFLWENRAGEHWWDPVANWCHAERAESEPGG
jgi:hypothetical protein